MVLASECQRELERLFRLYTSESHENKETTTLVDYDSTISEIRSIIQAVPLSTQLLSKMLREFFPHKQKPLSSHVNYSKLLIDLMKNVCHLQQVIMDIFVEKCLIVDHDIQWDFDGIESESDYDSDDSEVLPIIHNDNQDKSLKCDHMLDVILCFISSVSDKNDTSALEATFCTLLSSFEKYLLVTHKSKYTQYIYFYICSLDPAFPELFLGFLFKQLMDQQAPHQQRMTAISYIASYCSRASYLDNQIVQTTLQLLHTIAWSFTQVENGVKSFGGLKSSIASKPKQFSVYYNVIQAILYIFCFRYKDLVIDSNSSIVTGVFPPCLATLKDILTCSLHPLLFVSDYIAIEFSKICHSLEIMYAFPLFQSRKLSWNQVQMCDAYFPFDPMPEDWKSYAHIQDMFIHWDGENVGNTADYDDDVSSQLFVC